MNAQTLTAELSEKIRKWELSQKALAEAKEIESQLRKEVLESAFGFVAEADDREGTQNMELGNGYKLKAVFKLSRKLENKNGETGKALYQIAETGEAGKLIAERLVKWSPELSVSEYKKLPTNLQAIIDGCLVSKAATPSLSIVEPKVK